MYYDVMKMMHKNLSGNWPSSEKYISGKKLPDNQQVHSPVLQDNYLLYGTTGYGKTTLTKHIFDAVYGLHNVAVTRGALHVSDELTLNAILTHEISHSLCMDSVFNRIAFANVTAVKLGITLSSIIAGVFIWGVFLVLCAFGICKGFLSYFVTSGISKGTNGFFHALQHFILFIYKMVLGVVSRRCEYRADRYACILGYGIQLKYFLTTFIEPQSDRQKSLTKLIYDSHPAIYKRIMRIDQYEYNNKQVMCR